jgi:hypothetical protein
MREGRKPAQGVEGFDGANTLSSYTNTLGGENIQQNAVSQLLTHVNCCNHIPFVPKLFVIPSKNKPRAKVVQETDKRLHSAYAKPKTSLKTLQFHDESGNQVRSERREAAIALLQVMNYYQDDSTGRVGRLQDNGSFHDLSLSKLAKHAGIQLKRAKRAMVDIVRSGYIKVIKQFVRNSEGQVKGLPSIRSFLPKFFIDLDVKGEMWTKWFQQRGWAKERSEKKVTKQDRKKSRAMMGLIKENLGNFGTVAKNGVKKVLGNLLSVPTVPSQAERDLSIQYKQNMTRKALDMFNLDPSRTISEYYKNLIETHPLK